MIDRMAAESAKGAREMDKRPMDRLREPAGYAPPKDRRELLVRYARGERYFRRTEIKDEVFSAVNLSGSNFTDSVFGGSSLEGANLENTIFTNARFYKSFLAGSILRNCNLEFAYLTEADLEGADLTSADLSRSRASNTNFAGTNLADAKLTNSSITLDTYNRSRWTPEFLQHLHLRGLQIRDLEKFPADAQAAILRFPEGLSLYFNTRLTSFDRYIVDGVIFGVLGRNTDCRVVEFHEQGETAIVRLQASRREDLEIVAEVLHRRVWQQHERLARAALPAATAAVGGNVEGSVLVVGSGNIVLAGSEALARLGDVMAIQKLGTELTRLRDEMRKIELRVATVEGKPAEVVRTWEGQPSDDVT